MWIEFYDMSSGGTEKTPYTKIFIEAESEEEAVEIFENKFDRYPYNVTCECCGCDFAVYQVDEPEYSEGYLVINNHSK